MALMHYKSSPIAAGRDCRQWVDSGLPSLMQTYHPSADRASRTPAQNGRQDRASHFAST
jgi:hypothetical protein